MNEVGVVISRFYEDLKWIEQLKAPLDVYVYDRVGILNVADKGKYFYQAKGLPLQLDLNLIKINGVNLEIINMPDDLGYETSTYTHHFYSKYNELNDITVCLQGHPEYYIKNIITLLNEPYRLARTKWAASNPGRELNPAKLIISNELIDFSYISDNFGYVGPDYDYGWAPHKNDFTQAPWWFFCENMPGWTNDKSKLGTIDGFPFGAGNQFMVNKKNVLNHNPDYYRRIQEFTKTYMDPNGEKRPHWQQLNQGPNLLEGTWQFVF